MQMRSLAFGLMAAFIALNPAYAACTLQRLAQLSVTMSGLSASVPATINDKNVMFIVAERSNYSTISPASAMTLNLHPHSANVDVNVRYGGKQTAALVANIADFGLGDIHFKDLSFVVGGPDLGRGVEVGLLAQNVLSATDVEYDLTEGFIRLMRTKIVKNNR